MTRIGKELAPVVERLLREIESVVADTQALSAKSTGAVTIAALPSVSATLLPPVISQFHRQYSGITFRLREGAEKRILMLVKSEEVDFGIGCVDEADPEIHFEPLFTDWMSAVCAADSKLSRKKSVELKDLVSHPLILTDRESSVRRLVDRAFTSMGYPVTPAQEVTYMATALGMVKAGLGVAILPSSALELKELRSLKARPIHHEQLHRTVGVIQKAHHSLSPASGSFLQELRQACQDRQWTSASL
ncbi:MAG: hypothetical protein JO185_03710 [Acidobacteriaceae bacterium]|nr:hypothetical protein [Acidobacteriaceae bacterium]